MRKEIEQILSPGGAIAESHPFYEHRPGQVQMALAVAGAIKTGRHLCVEAGTGTGKTLAYLLPAIFSGKRVVISTATKNLQEQLFQKDIPFLEKALKRNFSVCYMKGRGNYLCLNRLETIQNAAYLFSPHDPAYLKKIKSWARQTETGDRAELATLPENLTLWQHIDARRETCEGRKCRNFENCFVTRVRQRALESDIVIVNHHLFFADLALRREDFGKVLPDYSCVVFDEAHEIEDVATQYFGVRISNYRLGEFLHDARAALAETGESSELFSRELDRLTEYVKAFFACFWGKEGRYVMRPSGGGSGARRGPAGCGNLDEAYKNLRVQIGAARMAFECLPVKNDNTEALIRRAREMESELAEILESESNEYVYWYEIRGRGVFLQSSPINLAPALSGKLFAEADCVVLTSATLSTGGDFSFIRTRLGIENAEELIVPSHFDFVRQAILYVPRNIPEPREAGWCESAAAEIRALLDASRGRAFLLFTSYAQMRQVYESLRDVVEFPLLMQGEKSKFRLLEEFRGTPGAVLFATSSFWQGVDVQGEQLSCVVIDKLPFAVPNDPVVAARIGRINETGGNAFYQYQIPAATILLKQGIGRLIRNRTDRGILAILDKRLVTKSYGRAFLESLPPAPMTHDQAEIRQFL
ncbi:MAG: ATP-dependent DNA helicase [Acidobacteriota bacterium]|nr:ATP-dependent DNA helicase [Acidobacteriota bacterium]